MNLRFFIDRPVFSIVISVIIVLLGIISLTGLPVEQYPDIAPPTVHLIPVPMPKRCRSRSLSRWRKPSTVWRT